MERTFLIGLRAQKPETRQKFFALYNDLVPKTIFDRLKYIFMDQDWERLSHTFWLKQAQVHGVSCLLHFLARRSRHSSDMPISRHTLDVAALRCCRARCISGSYPGGALDAASPPWSNALLNSICGVRAAMMLLE